jgi:hypothetical protein
VSSPAAPSPASQVRPENPDPQNGTKWNKNGGGSKMEHSQATTCDQENGTVVPFSPPVSNPSPLSLAAGLHPTRPSSADAAAIARRILSTLAAMAQEPVQSPNREPKPIRLK